MGRSAVAVAVGAVLVAGVLAGTGCTSQQGVAGAPPSKVEKVEDIRRPLDAYEVSTEQVLKLERIQRQMHNECLKKHGGTKDATPMDNLEQELATRARDRRTRTKTWGAFDPDGMLAKGYHFGETKAASYTLGEAPGDATTVCEDETEAKMPLKKGWSAIAGWPYGDKAVDPADDDPKWREAVDAWSTCMKQAGFRFRQPFDPMGEFSNPERDTARELAAAKADLACKRSTNFMPKAVAVQWDRDKQYIAQHKDQLEAGKKAIHDFLAAHP